MNGEPEYDVVIVGAGVSGALTAFKLAEAGFKVCVLEAGPEMIHPSHHVPIFYAQNTKTPNAPWPVVEWEDGGKPADRPSVIDTALNDTSKYWIQRGPNAFNSNYERTGGGTTSHWLGTCLRHCPHDFELRTKYLKDNNDLELPLEEGEDPKPVKYYARDWPITYDDLEEWYGKAEHEIGVSGDSAAWQDVLGAHRNTDYPMLRIEPSYMDQQYQSQVNGITINGKVVDVMSTPQGRNSTSALNGRYPCLGNTSCVPICPIQAKYDATVHIRKANNIANNKAEFRYKSVAYRVMVGDDDKITEIRYKQYDDDGNVTEGSVTGRIYVICAHAIETPKLLLMSPWEKKGEGFTAVANSSGQVGQNLMDHIIYLAWALTKEPVYPYRGPLSTSGIEAYRDGPERAQHAAYIIEIGNEGWNWARGAPNATVLDIMNGTDPLIQATQWYGEPLKQAVHDHITCQVRLASEMEALPLQEKSRVFVSDKIGADGSFDEVPDDEKDALGIPKPQINYEISEYTKRGLVDSIKTLNDIFTKLGVKNDKVFHDVMDKNPDDDPEYFEYEGKYYKYRGAGHIIGTYRMGDDPTDSVVNKYCRTHDHENLYLLGDGVFPTTATANPTLTIAALALRAADHIINQLTGG